MHPAESTLKNTLVDGSKATHVLLSTRVLLSGFGWEEREEAKKALGIVFVPEVFVPFNPRKVFEEQALPACWVMPGRRLAVSAPVHVDMTKDEVKRPWEKTNAKLDLVDVRPVCEALWCADIGTPVSCASWDVSEPTVALPKRNS
jgi:hypothetical protein